MPIGGTKLGIHFKFLPFLSVSSNSPAFWWRKVKLFVLHVVKDVEITDCILNYYSHRQTGAGFDIMLQFCSAPFPLLFDRDVSANPHQPLLSPLMCVAIDQCLLLSKG